MLISRFEPFQGLPTAPRYAVAAFCLLPCLACSGAHLDPSTKAITFQSSALSGSPQEKAAKPLTSAAPAATSANPEAARPSNPSPSPAAAGSKDNPVIPQNQVCSRLPDPPPLVSDKWLRVTVQHDRGTLSVKSVKEESARRASPTSRRMGRFAAELWIGCELIDRVRFDFPLMAAEEHTAKAPHEPNFESQGQFETTVLIPYSVRATRLELRDRARETAPHQVLVVPWPLHLDGATTEEKAASETPDDAARDAAARDAATGGAAASPRQDPGHSL